MLNENGLPDELAELEQELQRETQTPDPALKDKVLAGVQQQLRSEQGSDFWQFAAGVAAAVLLVLNLTLSTTISTGVAPRMEHHVTKPVNIQLDAKELGLTREELQRQAMLMAAGNELVRYTRPYGSLKKYPGMSNQ
jgi:hypothetical protein